MVEIADLFTDIKEHTIAYKIFDGLIYPWQALSKIGDFIKALGEELDSDKYEKRRNSRN